MYAWSSGSKFVEICKMTDIFEGNIIRVIRRLEELLRQLAAAATATGAAGEEAGADVGCDAAAAAPPPAAAAAGDDAVAGDDDAAGEASASISSFSILALPNVRPKLLNSSTVILTSTLLVIVSFLRAACECAAHVAHHTHTQFNTRTGACSVLWT